MTDSSSSSLRRIVLASRPQGAPTDDNFRVEDVPLPEPREGEMRLRTRYLSLDPYMRWRMNDGASYADPVAIGGVMVGGTVSEVEVSRHPKFTSGDLVLGFTGWQSHAISDGTGLNRLDRAMQNPSWALGVLGMPGFTAYYGLLQIGVPKPGETVVVGAATGGVGAVVGQIAKIKGCRAVGIAGGAKKCEHAVRDLGFDACVDHQAPDFHEQLAAACPQGIDVYFENVGGAVLDAVMPLLNVRARIPLCGLIAWYDMTSGHLPGPDRSAALLSRLLVKQIRIQGFVIIDYYESHYGAFLKDMSQWLTQGSVRFTEDVIRGLDRAPQAFMGLLRGDNFGKVVVEV
ncbi:MAG: putative oxidoreductase [Panacagrimonas sp.]|jgi:NADPH-dependent curcumin reductase CurA|nr:NADP-dependent oxidoreductase [Panacagrimonas sp.]MCC2656019.1 putative oxidoreductase [Panacagrimonas sp.]